MSPVPVPQTRRAILFDGLKGRLAAGGSERMKAALDDWLDFCPGFECQYPWVRLITAGNMDWAIDEMFREFGGRDFETVAEWILGEGVDDRG